MDRKTWQRSIGRVHFVPKEDSSSIRYLDRVVKINVNGAVVAAKDLALYVTVLQPRPKSRRDEHVVDSRTVV